MKKIIATTLFLYVFCFGLGLFQREIAICETVYGRAEKSDVGFYSSEIAKEPMFLLPLGYYVTIVGENGDFYSCEYAKTESSYTKKYGFVKKSEIYIDEEMSLPMFPEISIVAIKDVNLFSKHTTENVLSSITAGQMAQFYGVYKDAEKTLYYIKINGDFGYVETTGFEELEIPTHPKQLSTDSSNVELQDDSDVADSFASDDVLQEQSENNSSDVIFTPKFDVQLAMILCIAIPALVFMFYAFKPSSGEGRYFDE